MRLITLGEIDSTNRYLRALAEDGAEQGTLALAERQTNGRGRLDRRFDSPSGGLYMSLLLRPESALADPTLVTVMAALAAAEAIEEACPTLSVGIKWVNDLYLGERKLAGILAESSFSPSGTVRYVIVGIGVNLAKGNLDPSLAEIATSIEAHTGMIPDRIALSEKIALRLLSYLADPREVTTKYRRRMILLGRRIRCFEGSREYTARAIDVDEAGGLIVSRFGRKRTLRYGEVSIRIKK